MFCNFLFVVINWEWFSFQAGYGQAGYRQARTILISIWIRQVRMILISDWTRAGENDSHFDLGRGGADDNEHHSHLD